MNFRWGNPEILIYLWLPIILLVVFTLREQWSQRTLLKALGQKLSPVLLRSYSPARRRLKTVLLLLALTCFILSLARPQLGSRMDKIKSEGVELVIAMDVSTSMLAEDVKPSRLEHLKSEMSRLFDLLGGDKVGLIAFAGSSVLLSPLTPDKSALKMYLEGLSPFTVETQGTDVHKALLEARDAFDRGGVDPDEGAKVTRVILVASDGEDHEEGAIEEAKKLLKDGYRVFTVAFGTERGGPIPLRDERGMLRGYKKDRQGNVVNTSTKGKFLRDLAQAGGGSFFHAAFGAGEARAIKEDLDKLQKTEFASELATQYDEKFQIPLGIGLVFSFLGFILGDRRKNAKIWRGRFEAAR